MLRLRTGWTLTAVALCVLPLAEILSGCTSGVTPSGGPSTTTPTPRRTPNGTPGSTPIPGFTPAPTPSGTPINGQFVGSYSGTFNLPVFQEVGRTLTLQLNANGAATGTVSLTQGGFLDLLGSVSPAGDSITISGPALDISNGKNITITLTGRFAVAGGSVTGSGAVRDSEGNSGTWSVKRNF